MRPRVIGLFLKDREFAVKLVDYWSRKAPQYRYRVYTKPEKLCTDLASEPMYLLISDEEGYGALAPREALFTVDRAGRLAALTEGGEDPGRLWESRRIRGVRKFQPADALLADALGMRERLFPTVPAEKEALMIGESRAGLELLVPEEDERPEPERVPEQEERPGTGASRVDGYEGTVFGVFSPIGRCGKTRFALELASQCAGSGPTLYLSLEMFTDLYGRLLTSGGEDISDFLYALLEGTLASEMQEAARACGDGPVRPVIVTAAANPEDVAEIDEGALAEIIRYAGKAGFVTVVLDIGSSFARPLEALELCDVIYAPVTRDESSKRKWRHFSEYMRKRGRKELADRVVTLLLADTGDGYDGEGLPAASEALSAQVRRLLWEE